MSLNDIIDFILNCMYVIIRKGMLLSRTNFVMMSNIMLMFLLLLFLAGDVEKNPGPMGTPVSETNNKSLTIFHSNIRSLRNKINYISDIIEDFDIVFFTETHLDYLIPNVNIKCEGFETPIRKDRNSSDGGIILYYKNYVNISRRLDLEHSQVESTGTCGQDPMLLPFFFFFFFLRYKLEGKSLFFVYIGLLVVHSS